MNDDLKEHNYEQEDIAFIDLLHVRESLMQ